MSRLSLLALAGPALLAASTAAAQSCNGLPPNVATRFHGTADLAAGKGVKYFGAEVAFSLTGGLFGRLGATFSSYKKEIGGLARVGMDLGGGWAISLGSAKRFSICPMAGISGEPKEGVPELKSPGIPKAVSYSAHYFGVSTGYALHLNSTWEMTPFVEAFERHATMSRTYCCGTIDTPTSYQVMTAGVGLAYRQTLTLRPYATIPAKLSGGHNAFGLTATLTIGPGTRGRRPDVPEP